VLDNCGSTVIAVRGAGVGLVLFSFDAFGFSRCNEIMNVYTLASWVVKCHAIELSRHNLKFHLVPLSSYDATD
jgi:hypothetical protein